MKRRIYVISSILTVVLDTGKFDAESSMTCKKNSMRVRYGFESTLHRGPE